MILISANGSRTAAAPMAPRARSLNKSVHSPEHADFCELMVRARKKAGLTQREVAERLKKPQSFVAKYEGGERRIDVIQFLTITGRSAPIPPRSCGH